MTPDAPLLAASAVAAMVGAAAAAGASALTLLAVADASRDALSVAFQQCGPIILDLAAHDLQEEDNAEMADVENTVNQGGSESRRVEDPSIGLAATLVIEPSIGVMALPSSAAFDHYAAKPEA